MRDTNVFRPSGTASPAQPAMVRAPLLAFALCLVIGVVVIHRHTQGVAAGERVRAQAEAQARATALEMQLNSSLAAADVLSALVRQGGGRVPNFQQFAAELLAAHPALAKIELQPGGVTADVAPRAGHERAIGVNAFNDPASRSNALAALQTRRLAVAGPLALPRDGIGIVGRMPVFLPGRDGREAFWGFVAVSIRLRDIVHRARLDELTAKGCDFLLFAPARPGQAALAVVASGKPIRSGHIQQVVHAQNLELRLAVQPRSGWHNVGNLAVWLIGVVLVSALLAVFVWALPKWKEAENALARANEETVSAKADCARAQEQLARGEAQKLGDQEQTIRLKEQIATAQKDLAAANAQSVRDQEALARAREEGLREKEQLAQTNQQLAEDHQQLVGANAQLVREKEELAKANQRLSGELEKLTRVNVQLAREKEQLVKAIEQVTRDQEELARAKEQLDRNKERLDKADEQRARDQEQLKQFCQRIAELEQELAASKSALTPARVTVAASETPAETVPVPVATPPTVPESTSHESDGGATSLSPQAESCGDKDVAAPTELKPALRTKPPRQKKIRSDDQLSLFGEASPERPSPSKSETGSPSPVAEAAAPPESFSIPEQSVPADIVPLAIPVSAAPVERAADTLPVAPVSRRVTLVEEPLTEEPVAVEHEPALPPTEAVEPPGTTADASAKARRREKKEKRDETEAAPTAEPIPTPLPEGAPPAPADSRAELPEVEGLDAAAGFALADGQPKLYLKHLRQFVAEQANAAERIRDLLVQAKPDEAARLTHALRGAAEHIGATGLQTGAAALERAITGQLDPAEIESLWSALEKSLSTLISNLKLALKPKEEKTPAGPPPPPVDPPVLRRAVNEILPLLTDLDPGAAECLKANRRTFRSAFSVEGFAEFEQQVKARAYREALDLLKKAAKKHGVLR